jgi:hypothetical protein
MQKKPETFKQILYLYSLTVLSFGILGIVLLFNFLHLYGFHPSLGRGELDPEEIAFYTLRFVIILFFVHFIPFLFLALRNRITYILNTLWIIYEMLFFLIYLIGEIVIMSIFFPLSSWQTSGDIAFYCLFISSILYEALFALLYLYILILWLKKGMKDYYKKK